MEFQLTPSAVRDLEQIYEYVARHNLRAAGSLLRRFTQAFRQLAQQPGIGHLRQDLTEEPLLFWSVGSYLVIYRPELKPVQIVRVLHASRDLLSLLADEDELPH